MRVSYLVTLFNKAAFLPHLLAGLASQQGNFTRQYVFVDDGSTDDTLTHLHALTSGWPDVLIHSQPNAGPAHALNAGLALVDGDYVKPVDGDDQLYPFATAALLAACATCGTAYAYAPMDLQARYNPAETPQTPALLPIPPHIQPDFLTRALRRANTNPSVWIARTDLLRRLGGSDPGVFVQDYSLELRLAASGPAARLDAAVMAMPVEAPGRLSANDAQTLHDVNLALLRFLRAHPELPEKQRKFGMKRAAGRAWNWARRHGGGDIPHLAWAVLRAKLGTLPPNPSTEALLCAPFRQAKIRLCPDS
jgi:glycosyltransferase involved in cell wall biosynthesis